MLQVDKIVNSIFDSITWLLSDTESNRVWLVDCGDVDPIIEKIGGREIAGVLLTHAHFDHIYGLPKLIERFPNCKIYTNESGLEALADDRLNMSLYNESPIKVIGSYIRTCGEDNRIMLFDNVPTIVYPTPGHHPSCLSYVVEQYLFTGDSYIPNVKVVTNLPGGNKQLSQKSVDLILRLSQNRIICPGHFVKTL